MDVIVTLRFRVDNLYDERDLQAEPGRTPADFLRTWLADGQDIASQDDLEIVSIEPAPSRPV